MACQCGKKIEPVGEPNGEDALVISTDANHPANVICELCSRFYENGWCTGTGGGVSVKEGDHIYIAPSGVQKERMKPENMFVISLESKEYLRQPVGLKPSSCTPLFMSAYNLRDAGAVIHTHSQAAVMVTLMFDEVFEISHVEQIKAIPRVTEPGYLMYSSKLVIPIVDNTEREEQLEETLQMTMKKYPAATAVLVRRHGIHVWGENIWKAKVYNEAIDYLLELAVKMKLLGIPTVKSD